MMTLMAVSQGETFYPEAAYGTEFGKIGLSIMVRDSVMSVSDKCV